MDKKGFQIAANMLVVIILSIVLFSAGMFIFTDIIREGANIEATVTENLRVQMEEAMDDGSVITIPQPRLTLQPGETGHFAYGFYNEMTAADFDLDISANAPTPLSWNSYVSYVDSYDMVPQNERVYALIAVTVPAGTASGQYSYDIELSRESSLYGSRQRIYIVVP